MLIGKSSYPFTGYLLMFSRLVNNILLAFLAAPRADSKRFEMLSILSTILSWDDSEREKAGLQKVGKGKAPPMRRKGSTKDVERSAEEEAAMNEVSPNYMTKVDLLMVVILKPVCRVPHERVITGASPCFPLAPTWRFAFTRCQVTRLHIVLANELWSHNACTRQRAPPSHVFGFEHIDHGSW